ncbi:membrane progestin receptor epsilon-like [Paroedura picta]|uniref:membrane progestin receptor epsilon-like n=1 Tax=Paroedura picta TaxID=143630 RepID=UPI0040578532
MPWQERCPCEGRVVNDALAWLDPRGATCPFLWADKPAQKGLGSAPRGLCCLGSRCLLGSQPRMLQPGGGRAGAPPKEKPGRCAAPSRPRASPCLKISARRSREQRAPARSPWPEGWLRRPAGRPLPSSGPARRRRPIPGALSSAGGGRRPPGGHVPWRDSGRPLDSAASRGVLSRLPCAPDRAAGGAAPAGWGRSRTAGRSPPERGAGGGGGGSEPAQRIPPCVPPSPGSAGAGAGEGRCGRSACRIPLAGTCSCAPPSPLPSSLLPGARSLQRRQTSARPPRAPSRPRAEPSRGGSMGVGGKMPLGAGQPGVLLLRSSEVPPSVTESFILSGYRCPGCTFAQCLVSAFQPTNETGNFWTHFLAVFIFAFRFLEQFWSEGSAPPRELLDPFYYPLWNYFLGVCGLLVASSMAHLFNSMSLVIREICFYIDYGTISAYTVGSSLAYFYYIQPRGLPGPAAGATNLSSGPGPGGEGVDWLSVWVGRTGTWFEALYVPTACLIALFCTLACCSSRHQWPQYRYLIRTLVFLLPFVVVSIPVFHKLWWAGGGQGTGRFFLRHCFWLLASGIFNVSKIPERFSPGKFDIWGHSHQWFHCCTFLSILDELHMIRGEIQELGGGPPLPPLSRVPTFLSTFGVMLILLLLLASIVACFGVKAYARQEDSQRRKGD